jgi:hypothetical protein
MVFFPVVQVDEGIIQEADAKEITRRMRRKAIDRGLLNKHIFL